MHARVEGGIADDQRAPPDERLVDACASQQRRRGQVGQHVRLAERVPVEREHLEREPVQRPVRDDDQPPAAGDHGGRRREQSGGQLVGAGSRPAVRAPTCTAFASRAISPFG